MQYKIDAVTTAKEKMLRAKSILVTDYRGLTVDQMTDLRNRLRKEGVEYKIVKNTLLTIAAKRLGIRTGFPVFSWDNLTNKGVTGQEANVALDAAGITVNKNGIPFDEKPPTITSGIRIGTPIVSTRGMKEPEMAEIADMTSSVIDDVKDAANLARVREKARALAMKFPVFERHEASAEL